MYCAVEESKVDANLVDNVAESGEESEDEWNYYKGERGREQNAGEEEVDEAPRSETPGQDNVSKRNAFYAPVYILGIVTKLLFVAWAYI